MFWNRAEREREREREKEREKTRVQYLHGLRLMHAFDCILCHSPGRKRDKRTSCRREGRDVGGREERRGRRRDERETKQDKRVGQVVIKPKKQRLYKEHSRQQCYTIARIEQLTFNIQL